MKTSLNKGEIFAIIASILWGINYIVVKAVLKSVPESQFLLIRFVLSSILFAAFLLICGKDLKTKNSIIFPF